MITTWNQVPRRLAYRQDGRCIGPGVDSGTFDYFTETIGGESGASRGDFTASEDDNLIIPGAYPAGRNGVRLPGLLLLRGERRQAQGR